MVLRIYFWIFLEILSGLHITYIHIQRNCFISVLWVIVSSCYREFLAIGGHRMSDFSSAFYHTSVIINSLFRKIQPFILKSRYIGVYVYKWYDI